MVSTPTSATEGITPFVADKNSEGAAILKDLRGRSGPVKIAECDEGIVLDAEALTVCPDGESPE